MGTDEAALRADLESASFREGIVLKRWRIVAVTWPYLIVGVAAAPRNGAPSEFVIRAECSGYPAQAPFGQFWDADRQALLDPKYRPLRAHPERDESLKNFPNFYTAFDRSGLAAHSHWASDMPAHAWRPGRTITHYLREVYELFNNARYLGVNVA